MWMPKALAFLVYIFFLGILSFGFGTPEKPNVSSEVNASVKIVEEKVTFDIREIINDKYLVSALYYSDSFIKRIMDGEEKTSFQKEIIINLSTFITKEFKDKYINGLISLFPDDRSKIKHKLSLPLDKYRSKLLSSAHGDAIDLFAKEGSNVKSMSYGVVVLSENDWMKGEPYKTVSNNGGNQIIIFNPDTKSFYRYCHLKIIRVETGEIVESGQIIGTVGHTGLIASQYGHGEHLHLEINQYRKGSVTYLSQRKLTELLQSIRKK